MLALNRRKRIPFHVDFLSMARPAYPQDKFDSAFDAMVKAMKDGQTIEQIIARCQKTGDLTKEQLKRLQEAAPKSIDENDGE